MGQGSAVSESSYVSICIAIVPATRATYPKLEAKASDHPLAQIDRIGRRRNLVCDKLQEECPGASSLRGEVVANKAFGQTHSGTHRMAKSPALSFWQESRSELASRRGRSPQARMRYAIPCIEPQNFMVICASTLFLGFARARSRRSIRDNCSFLRSPLNGSALSLSDR